ncbi:uncharacterized protein METZ01_LOCUS212236, partial [marine metagenome]
NTQVNASDGTVSVSDSPDTGLTGTWLADADSTTVSGTSTLADIELRIGDVVGFSSGNANSGIVTSIVSNTEITLAQATGGLETIGLGGATAITGPASLSRKKRSAFKEPSGTATNPHMLGSLSVGAGGTIITGTDTNFTRQVHVGDILTFKDDTTKQNNRRRVTAIGNSTSLTVATKLDFAVTTAAAYGGTWSREWEYASNFGSEPLTSVHAYNVTGSKDVGDEIHVVIVDEDGDILGAKDVRGGNNPEKQVIEKYEAVSVASGATGTTGEILYYKEAINDKSDYVRWTDHDAMGDAPLDAGSNKITYDWGAALDTGNTSAYFSGAFSDTGSNGIMTASFSSGVDGYSDSASDEITAYSYFKDPAKIDVSLLISGEASNTLCTYLINEIAETRKDCVVFISPEEADVVNTEGNEVTNAIARRNAMPSTSYAVMDGSYKYMFDRYNSVYRWVPMNGDVAGICAQADNVNPYVSPAGFTRGNIKGAEFIAYVPNNAERDDLYLNGINPIASFPGKGKVLFGDKTLLARPSSFDRI